MPKSTFTVCDVKLLPNGPLAPLAHSRQRMLARVRTMLEDRDARAELSVEPDLTEFPDFCWQFLGGNLSTEGVVEKSEDGDFDEDEAYVFQDDKYDAMADRYAVYQDNAYERGEYLRSPSQPSAEGWWFMDLPFRERLLFEEREWNEHVAQQHSDYINHMRTGTGMDYDEYDDYVGRRPHNKSDDYDKYGDWDIPTVEEMEAIMTWQEAEEERLLETLSISHSGGLRGLRATKGAVRNLSRPHHYLQLEVA